MYMYALCRKSGWSSVIRVQVLRDSRGFAIDCTQFEADTY